MYSIKILFLSIWTLHNFQQYIATHPGTSNGLLLRICKISDDPHHCPTSSVCWRRPEKTDTTGLFNSSVWVVVLTGMLLRPKKTNVCFPSVGRPPPIFSSLTLKLFLGVGTEIQTISISNITTSLHQSRKSSQLTEMNCQWQQDEVHVKRKRWVCCLLIMIISTDNKQLIK